MNFAVVNIKAYYKPSTAIVNITEYCGTTVFINVEGFMG